MVVQVVDIRWRPIATTNRQQEPFQLCHVVLGRDLHPASSIANGNGSSSMAIIM